MILYKSTLAFALAGAVTASAAATAIAGTKTGKGHVTARSHYGNGKLTVPVRKAQYGYQVRFPGGLWYYCEVSCIDTLRREVLDFWETRSEDSGNGDFD